MKTGLQRTEHIHRLANGVGKAKAIGHDQCDEKITAGVERMRRVDGGVGFGVVTELPVIGERPGSG